MFFENRIRRSESTKIFFRGGHFSFWRRCATERALRSARIGMIRLPRLLLHPQCPRKTVARALRRALAALRPRRRSARRRLENHSGARGSVRPNDCIRNDRTAQ
jgi:hypothetical protein